MTNNILVLFLDKCPAASYDKSIGFYRARILHGHYIKSIILKTRNLGKGTIRKCRLLKETEKRSITIGRK